MINISKLKIIFVISLLIATTFVACDDEEWIPYERVDLLIELNRLTNVGLLEATYWQGGVSGLILFRLEDEIFLVYDRACPYEATGNCKVDIQETPLFAECGCCESVFVISDGGYPNEGPAAEKGRPLKQYRASVSNRILHIHN